MDENDEKQKSILLKVLGALLLFFLGITCGLIPLFR